MKNKTLLLFVANILNFTSCNSGEANKAQSTNKPEEKKNLGFTKYYPKGQSKFKFHEDFNKGVLNKTWRKETTKNNQFVVDTISNKVINKYL